MLSEHNSSTLYKHSIYNSYYCEVTVIYTMVQEYSYLQITLQVAI